MSVISNEEMKTIVAKAILEKMSKDDRDLLIQQALEALLEPQTIKVGYQEKPGPSKLQEIFNLQAFAVANDLVREHLRNDEEGKKQILDLVKKAMSTAVLDSELGEKITEALGTAIANVLSRGY